MSPAPLCFARGVIFEKRMPVFGQDLADEARLKTID
jgi:hypothetical protein